MNLTTYMMKNLSWVETNFNLDEEYGEDDTLRFLEIEGR